MISTQTTAAPKLFIGMDVHKKSWTVYFDMALQQYYRKYAHAEPNKAIIKVAHELLSRMRAVINSGIHYQEGLVK